MDKIKIRDEVDNENKWNIELIYKDIKSFNNDLVKLEENLTKLDEKISDFLNSKEDFKAFFIFDEKIERSLEKLAVYTHCKSDEDKDNTIYQELDGKVTNIYAKYEEKTASIIPKILETDENIIKDYLNDGELNSYNHFFDVILKKKKHILNKEVEKTLAAYLKVLGASSETSSYLMDADLKFGTIKDENKKSVELTETNYSSFIRSENRTVRKEAFQRIHTTFGSVKNTLTSTYSQTVNYSSITARIRNYKSSIEMYLSPNNIPTKLYDNLIKTINNNLEPLYKYYSFKKDALKLDEFHLYDGYVKIIKDSEKKYSFEEAKDIVINALSILGDDYSNVLNSAFRDKWIDIYPNRNKRSGAYSTGSYDTLPYVLLNYTNTYNDVSTLAHELGHSMHTFYANNNQEYINASYPIFLAEIASTTNELLLSNYMYENSNSKEEKLTILNERLDLFKATLYRQTMFAEFEQNAHKYVDDNNVLTSDYLCNIYYELNKKYFGSNVFIDDEIKYEWLRIPHFYTAFYVYQYATSLSIACYVCENIVNNKKGFKEKYIKLLSSGGKDYPLNLLKIIDIDLTDSKVFESAVRLFEKTLEEFISEYNKM